MKTQGNRIYFNQFGNIIYQTGECKWEGLTDEELENIQRPTVEDINYIDIDYGTIDYDKIIIKSINIETKEAIIEEIPTDTDPMIEYIKELEKQLGIEQSQIPNFGL